MKALGLWLLSFLLSTATSAAILQSSSLPPAGDEARDPRPGRPAPMPVPAPTDHYAAWSR